MPVSVAETQMHYLPCGAHKGREAAERERTASFHRAGLARLVYFNPLLCVSYSRCTSRALAAGVLQSLPGGLPFAYPAFVGGGAPLGFSVEPLAQFDFTHPATEPFLAELVREAVADGVDGWMEDFGESTPPAIRAHDGSTGSAAHNRYPADYHCAFRRIAARVTTRPLVRFQRSGWTGAARCADVVWGGDPTTVWGFDGISSAVTQLISAGLSGVSRWATDIGGYNSFGGGIAIKPGATEDEKLTRELLVRWIELGALAPVMRTKRSGLAVPSYARPQVYDAGQLDVWRRLTELHTQLNPYLRAADADYRPTGLPIARHLALVYPREGRARTTGDEYMLGSGLLAAPVTRPGLRERGVWLPPGRWVDWWRSTTFDGGSGAYGLDRLRVLRGGADRVLPAPLGQPPLLLKAGTILPLLPADVDTLTGYGRAAGLTRLGRPGGPPAPAGRPARSRFGGPRRRAPGPVGRAPRPLAARATGAALDGLRHPGVAGRRHAAVPAAPGAGRRPPARAVALELRRRGTSAAHAPARSQAADRRPRPLAAQQADEQSSTDREEGHHRDEAARVEAATGVVDPAARHREVLGREHVVRAADPGRVRRDGAGRTGRDGELLGGEDVVRPPRCPRGPPAGADHVAWPYADPCRRGARSPRLAATVRGDDPQQPRIARWIALSRRRQRRSRWFRAAARTAAQDATAGKPAATEAVLTPDSVDPGRGRAGAQAAGAGGGKVVQLDGAGGEDLLEGRREPRRADRHRGEGRAAPGPRGARPSSSATSARPRSCRPARARPCCPTARPWRPTTRRSRSSA